MRSVMASIAVVVARKIIGMKLNRKRAGIVTSVLISLCMSVAMSLAMTAVNTGMDGYFVGRWLRGFAVAFVIALPVGFVIVPLIQNLGAKFTAD